jgi:hypothetical protein
MGVGAWLAFLLALGKPPTTVRALRALAFMVTGLSRALAILPRDSVYREMRGTAERESVTPVTPSYRTPITLFLLPLFSSGYNIGRPRPLVPSHFGPSSAFFYSPGWSISNCLWLASECLTCPG